MNAPIVSMVSSATATETRDVRSESIMEGIRSGGKQRLRIKEIRHKFQRVLHDIDDSTTAKRAVDTEKKKLPAVTWSGRFSRRASEALVTHSGLLCADLDGLGKKLADVRKQLLTSPHLWALFLSPTGDGLKAVFRVTANAEKHLASFLAVKEHVLQLTGEQVDDSCKDLARLCFVSFDSDAYLNTTASELPPLTVEGAMPKATNSQSPPENEKRRRIATELLGEIEWTSDITGFCVCPGRRLHTTGNGARDGQIYLDGVPTLHCVHNSCGGICTVVNHELRSRVGKAESAQTVPSRIETKCRAVELPTPPAPYTAPPLDLLPPELRDYVCASTESLNVDVGYVLLPMLSNLGSAIGDARSILLKRGFNQPPIIWSGIVGTSGSRKSPALDAGCFAATEHERELGRQNKDAVTAYEEQLSEWEMRQRKERGTKPAMPPSLTCLMDDLTLAALADALETNPRGVLVKKDELSHWFATMDQFHNGKGADVSRWLSLHTGVFFGLDRKTDHRRSRLWQPRVCITGGIQPAVLGRVLTQDFFERGLPARFLFAAPPPKADRWSESTIPDHLRAAVLTMFEALYELQPDQNDGEPRPKLLRLDADAKDEFVRYYNECGAAAAEADEREEAAWSKLSGYAARLALVGQCAQKHDADAIGGEVMFAACKLARWFGAEAVRIYASLSETAEQAVTRRLVEFIQGRGGAVTVREAITYYRPLRNQTAQAEGALTGLGSAGLGEWEPVAPTERGGRPTRRFRLKTATREASASAIPPVFPRKGGGYADADKNSCVENAELEAEVLVL